MYRKRTVMVRPQWLQSAVNDAGSQVELADRLSIDKSTLNRQLGGKSEAGPRFIAAVLATFPIEFQDAFDVVEEEEIVVTRPKVLTKAV